MMNGGTLTINHEVPPCGRCSHKRYKLSCEEYDDLVGHARGRCQTCSRTGEETEHGFLVIDHDPLVGIWGVRGLLCSSCNLQIAYERLPKEVMKAYLDNPWYARRRSVPVPRGKRPALALVQAPTSADVDFAELDSVAAEYAALQGKANAAKQRLFDAAAACARMGLSAESIADRIKANKQPEEAEAGLNFTAAYLRKQVRNRGVAPLRSGPKKR